MLSIKVVFKNRQGSLYIPCSSVDHRNQILEELFVAMKHQLMLQVKETGIMLNGSDILYARKAQTKRTDHEDADKRSEG